MPATSKRLRFKTRADLEEFLHKPTQRQQRITRLTEVEAQEGAALVSWARWHARHYPMLGRLYHIPNGEVRDAVTAAKLQRMGVLAGMPDYCLPYPARGFGAWYGELKTSVGTLSIDQHKMLMALRLDGNFAGVFYGWEQARKSLEWYLSMVG